MSNPRRPETRSRTKRKLDDADFTPSATPDDDVLAEDNAAAADVSEEIDVTTTSESGDSLETAERIALNKRRRSHSTLSDDNDDDDDADQERDIAERNEIVRVARKSPRRIEPGMHNAIDVIDSIRENMSAISRDGRRFDTKSSVARALLERSSETLDETRCVFTDLLHSLNASHLRDDSDLDDMRIDMTSHLMSLSEANRDILLASDLLERSMTLLERVTNQTANANGYMTRIRRAIVTERLNAEQLANAVVAANVQEMESDEPTTSPTAERQTNALFRDEQELEQEYLEWIGQENPDAPRQLRPDYYTRFFGIAYHDRVKRAEFWAMPKFDRSIVHVLCSRFQPLLGGEFKVQSFAQMSRRIKEKPPIRTLCELCNSHRKTDSGADQAASTNTEEDGQLLPVCDSCRDLVNALLFAVHMRNCATEPEQWSTLIDAVRKVSTLKHGDESFRLRVHRRVTMDELQAELPADAPKLTEEEWHARIGVEEH